MFNISRSDDKAIPMTKRHLSLAVGGYPNREKGLVSSSRLILIGFASAFFPRLFASFGAPSIINFVHFGIIPSAFLISICTTKTRDRLRLYTLNRLLVATFALLLVIGLSALINEAGLANVFLQFMFQAEPFLLLAAIVAVPITGDKLKKFRYWLLGFALFNLLLAIVQSVLLPIGLYPKPQGGTLQDNIVGVFGGGGGSAANYISCTFSFYFALSLSRYLFLSLSQTSFSLAASITTIGCDIPNTSFRFKASFSGASCRLGTARSYKSQRACEINGLRIYRCNWCINIPLDAVEFRCRFSSALPKLDSSAYLGVEWASGRNKVCWF